MKKNAAGQVIGCQMVLATDGSAFTGTTTVYVTGNGGTQAIGSVGSGVCTHEGNGFHIYAPAQAETNYDHIGFTFVGTGAIPATLQVYTSFPQTTDNPASLPNSGALTTIQADLDDIQTRLPAALVSGRMDASVGAMAANVITATAIAADAITDAKVASDVTIASVTGSVGSVTGLTASNLDVAISTRLAPTVAGRTLDVTTTGEAGIDWGNIGNPTTAVNLSATNIDVDQVVASVSGAVGSVTGNVGGNVTGSVGSVTGLTNSTIADQVWDEVLSGHLTAGTTGNALNAAGAAGDPWSTVLPGAYGAGTAGKIVGDNINATISSRATQTSVDTVDDFLDTEVAAIKAKTDALPADPADASDIAAAFATVNTKLDTIDDYIDAEVAAIKAKTDLIPAAPAAVGDIPTALQNADALLNRDMASVSDTNARTPLNALRFIRNKWSVAGTTLTVTKENDTTTAWTAAVTAAPGADPISGSDPA